MTQFEFVSVAVSIVLALSAARVLKALPHVMAPGRGYWIHALWCLTLLSMHLGFWWAIWIYREIDPWTFRGFASVMLTPALMYLTVGTLVTDSPASIESWRVHFYARHRSFFGLYLASFLSIPLRQYAVLGDVGAPVAEGTPGMPLTTMALLLLLPATGVFVTTERAHAVLAVIGAGLFFSNLASL